MLTTVIIVIIVAALVVIGCIVAFIVFLKGGVKGAKEDRSLFEKGQISKEQYDSGYNQGAKDVVKMNYDYIKKVDEARKKQEAAGKAQDAQKK